MKKIFAVAILFCGALTCGLETKAIASPVIVPPDPSGTQCTTYIYLNPPYIVTVCK